LTFTSHNLLHAVCDVERSGTWPLKHELNNSSQNAIGASENAFLNSSDSSIINKSLIWLVNKIQHPIGSVQKTEMIISPLESVGLSLLFILWQPH